jgi:hypothetical protein
LLLSIDALGGAEAAPAPLPELLPLAGGTFDDAPGGAGVNPGSSGKPGIDGPVTGGGVSTARGTEGDDVTGAAGSDVPDPMPGSITDGSTTDVGAGTVDGVLDPEQSPDGQGLDGVT